MILFCFISSVQLENMSAILKSATSGASVGSVNSCANPHLEMNINSNSLNIDGSRLLLGAREYASL